MKYEENVRKAKIALLAMQRYSWEQAVAMQAFFEWGDQEVLFALAKAAAYRNLKDGRIAAIGTMGAVTDPCAPGRGVLYAAEETGDEELKNAHAKLIKWALYDAPRNEEGIVYHWMEAKEFWIDSMYMLPPYLAAAGHYDEALKQIYGYWDKLYLPDKGLMAHMWNDEKGTFRRVDCWGGGNGWTIAGLTEVIDLLPVEKENEKNKLIKMTTQLIETIATHIREDGLSHDILDDTSTFVEVNLPQMLSYSIYKGIKSGWLEEKWKALADKCRKAANEKVDAYGFVQDVCGAPHFAAPGVAPEGQAFYLMMEAVAF